MQPEECLHIHGSLFFNAMLSVIIITKDKVILITLVYVENSGRLRNNTSYNRIKMLMRPNCTTDLNAYIYGKLIYWTQNTFFFFLTHQSFVVYGFKSLHGTWQRSQKWTHGNTRSYVPGKEYFWKTSYNKKKEQDYKNNMTVSSMMDGIILLILNLK